MDEKNKNKNQATNQDQVALDDARRVKVMSPSMLVMKRFLRNKLAITGMVILVVMFLFSFVGGILSPYSQSQVFKGTQVIQKDYATANLNKELRYTTISGEAVPTSVKAKAVLTINEDSVTFEVDGEKYSVLTEGEEFYTLQKIQNIGKVFVRTATEMNFTMEEGKATDAFKEAFQTAYTQGEESFVYEGEVYTYQKEAKIISLGKSQPYALASKKIFDTIQQEDSAIVASYAFRYAAEKAVQENQSQFELDGVTYSIETSEEEIDILDEAGEPFAVASEFIIDTVSDTYLTADFKSGVRKAIREKSNSFVLTEADGSEVEYRINRSNANYYVRTDRESEIIRINEPPSKEHWLGLDGNGMDIMTRLMYGGRISLMVGFVVVLLELVIGILIGGISGYFGGWLDTFLMRVVDLFNSIPFWPIAIILGSVMDELDVTPLIRIFMLMMLLGLVGWTGIARVVRGQILSLREQDFMVATEATGISVPRRIFKHLVPNVMPLLIVQATMSLGSIIIMEATLSFLGLGVKYPLASWGSIINAANDIHIMSNYWFIWLPAGLLMLLSVLGFNFVGDGLRDAFDPKMKR